ncbi:MAG: glycosyltransferase family 4 protein, partial [Pseudomonadales bacterium]|nr:glycosyltransferase family 4 protein [Pseudomonadales bacterium]
ILVISDLPPYVLGGAEAQAARLVEQWLKDGIEVECAAHRTPGGVYDFEAKSVSVTHIEAKSRFRMFRALKFAFGLAKWLIIRARKADVIYCRFLGEAALTAICLKALGLINLPVVSCPGCFGKSGDAHILRSLPGWKLLIPLINRYCDAINILADPIGEELRALGVDQKLFIRIPNAIPVREKVLREVHSPLRFLFAGRCEHAKGIDVLLEAWESAVSRVWNTKRPLLTIAGDGSQLNSLKTLSQSLHAKSSIQFSGRVSPERVRALMLEHDILVLPSREEGFSNVVLEAMESGMPVIVTQLGGVDRFIDGSSGWVVCVEDSLALSAILIDVFTIGESSLLVKGNNARAIVEQKFRIDVVASAHLELFMRLLKQSPY